MIALIKNEFIKLFKNKKTIIIFIGLIIVMIGMVANCYISDKKFSDNIYSIEEHIENAESVINYNNKEIEVLKYCLENEPNLTELEISKIKDRIENNKEGIEYQTEFKKEIEEMLSKESPEVVLNIVRMKKQIITLKEEIERFEHIKKNTDMQDEIDRIDSEIKIREEYLPKFEKLLNDKHRYIEAFEYDKYNMFMILSKLLGLGLLGILSAMIMSDIVSGECSPATFKFLLIQPVKKGKILLSKFIVGSTSILLMVFSGQIIIFILVGLTSKINSCDNPISIGAKYIKIVRDNGNFNYYLSSPGTVITNSELFIKAIFIQILVVITMCSFVFMISTLSKNTIISMSVSVLSLLGITIGVNVMPFLAKIGHLLFTTYADVVGVYTGSISGSINNINVSMGLGIIVMIVTTIITYAIAHINFTKKNFAI